MKRKVFICLISLIMTIVLAGCGSAAQEEETVVSGYQGIDVESPEWVGSLDAAKDVHQILVVAAFSQEATDAWISLHEKQDDGTWHMVMTSPGFIGKNGLGKTQEGDAKTDVSPQKVECE